MIGDQTYTGMAPAEACKLFGHQKRAAINTLNLAMAVVCERCGEQLSELVVDDIPKK